MDPGSGARVTDAEVRCRGFGVDGGALFAGLGFDTAKTGAPSVRTKSGGSTEMVGGRISLDSRTGAPAEGANSLVRRDGAALRPSGGALLRTARTDAGGIGNRSAISLQHDLFDHQSGAVSLHDFPATLHGAGVPEFSWPSPALDAQDQEKGISHCGWAPGTQGAFGESLAGRAP